MQGRVVEYYSRRGVPGVQVNVGGHTAVTDMGGSFSVNVPPGEYVIVTSIANFEPFEGNLSIGGATSYNVDDIAIRQTMVRAL